MGVDGIGKVAGGEGCMGVDGIGKVAGREGDMGVDGIGEVGDRAAGVYEAGFTNWVSGRKVPGVGQGRGTRLVLTRS